MNRLLFINFHRMLELKFYGKLVIAKYILCYIKPRNSTISVRVYANRIDYDYINTAIY